MPKLKNKVILEALNGLQQLAAFDLTDTKTNWNIGRSIKYLRKAQETIESDRVDLTKVTFGDKPPVGEAMRQHEKFREFEKIFNHFMNEEETEVEKLFMVTIEGLTVKEGSKAVPGSILQLIEPVVTGFEE